MARRDESLADRFSLGPMHILYLDESGVHDQASYFVLAGMAVFEREIHWFSQDLDALQAEFFPDLTESVHFHASRLNVPAGGQVEEPWSGLTVAQRRDMKARVYDVIRARRGVLFGCAIEKRFSEIRKEDPYERAFEDLLSRFDMFLSRSNRSASMEGRDEQRGLVVLAESGYQKTVALLGKRFRERGTRWGALHNVSDVPLFAPARDMRLLQYADFISNATFGRYHAGLTKDFDRIAGKFDQEGNVVHGLVHLTIDNSCSCIACFSRRGRQPGLPSF